MRLDHVSMGWRGLETVVNRLVDAINANEPIEGAGIRLVNYGPQSGTLIETAADNKGNSPSGGGGGGPAVGNQVWHGVKWQDVDVVDTHCNKSTITVLVYTGNSGDSIAIQ